jgi:hypothetical protein
MLRESTKAPRANWKSSGAYLNCAGVRQVADARVLSR